VVLFDAAEVDAWLRGPKTITKKPVTKA